jgi:PKD repeat protein
MISKLYRSKLFLLSIFVFLTACVRDIDVNFTLSSNTVETAQEVVFTPKVFFLGAEDEDEDHHKNQKGKGHHDGHSNGLGHGNISKLISKNFKQAVWNFGDGNTLTATDLNPVNHSYSTAGVYTVTLTVYSKQGFSDSYSQAITVTQPVAWCNKDVLLSNGLPADWSVFNVRSGPGIVGGLLTGSPVDSGASIVSNAGAPASSIQTVSASFDVQFNSAYFGQLAGVELVDASGDIWRMQLAHSTYFGANNLRLDTERLNNLFHILAFSPVGVQPPVVSSTTGGFVVGNHRVSMLVSGQTMTVNVANLDNPSIADISFTRQLPADFSLANIRRMGHYVYTTTDNSITSKGIKIQCM